uniref:TIGR00341 family protein n=1 Tax=Chlamydomonas leiostraca TaxID=1034604 RepID=A0A7S0RRS5_9CHLO|mmetsp:Transcript_29976/g.76323  ORF Transcript_29976/g.76323 Transcript_29976/m.76323 type:complete len:453 (+) Transcript_29976:143-1501(+)|eukprot:CAMPEP_0202884744 /NCGR_PEP_ID=MMETSP1391-20130828/41306_1 /ASSEMBLY_ACC=CAM_ASM_000867 /TAXON_ID=1034604 /ORGANISM="Chlamydomonas leiostraca, Strain SAG 11-49" /LENGTH=452 /DNA_ID=CAMNT_0049567971 /DNA_START=103 /DNA_END=1461 /DNA_ORIENTATION=+
MRQISITCEIGRSNEVVDLLQGPECGLVCSRYNSDGLSTIITHVLAEQSGSVLHELDKIGCGVAWGKLAVIPVAVTKPIPKVPVPKEHGLRSWPRRVAAKFEPTATSRLAIEEIYKMVDDQCGLSTDFLMYILIAAIIATLGLISNSGVMIIASMLLSPLMGPILGFSLGTMMFDHHLMLTGLVCEFIGILETFMVGFVMGLICSGWTDVPKRYNWPTAEMASRGDVPNLLLGFFFAVPSGAGVALACTQGGVNSLVGVAIAASLLPPICNAGLNIGFGLVGAARHHLDPHNVYNENEFLRIGGVSFALFVINVVSIYSTCLLLFLFKGIKPVRRQLTRYQELPPILTGVPPADTASALPHNKGSGDSQSVQSDAVKVEVLSTAAIPAITISTAAAAAASNAVLVAAAGGQQQPVKGVSLVSAASKASSNAEENWDRVREVVKTGALKHGAV